MSHSTVTLRISAARLALHRGNVEYAVDEMLAPYEESPEDEARAKTYLVFDDGTDKARAEYESNDKDGIELRDEYKSFDAYAKDYHGYEKRVVDGKTRWGRMHNPNARWDWYEIGGRWHGFYPLKSGARRRLGRGGAFHNQPTAGHGDVVHVSDIDMDVVATKTRNAAVQFVDDYQAWLGGKVFGFFNGPREKAMTIGLVTVEQDAAVIVSSEMTVIPWKTSDKRNTWRDVCRPIEREAFLRDYMDAFNVIATFAGLDDEGWHEVGEMGWFGCSSSTPDSYMTFKRGFMDRFVRAAAPDDTLVVVDVHI